MKQWITLGIGAVVLLASCDKQSALDGTSQSLVASASTTNSTASARATASSNGAYASDWSQSASWSSYDSSSYRIYYTTQSDPAITGDIVSSGVVLTFGRTNVSAPEYQQFNEPTMLPFYFVGTNGRPVKNAYYFYDRASEGSLRISYSTQVMDGSMPAGTSLSQFQFRHFVFPASFLAEHNITEQDLRSNYTYSQVLDLSGFRD